MFLKPYNTVKMQYTLTYLLYNFKYNVSRGNDKTGRKIAFYTIGWRIFFFFVVELTVKVFESQVSHCKTSQKFYKV